MASTLVFQRLRHDLGLDLFFQVHLLEPPVFILELFHARHHLDIHAAIFSPPLVKGGGADAQLPANIRHSKSSLKALDRVHDLTVSEF